LEEVVRYALIFSEPAFGAGSQTQKNVFGLPATSRKVGTLVNAAFRAKLEAMATENQQIVVGEDGSEVPSDSELFAGEVHEELSARDLFAGDEDFYKLLADSTQATATQQPPGVSQPSVVPIQHKRFSTLQKVLVISIVAIVAMLLYALLISPQRFATSLSPTSTDRLAPTVQQTSSPKLPVEDAVQRAPERSFPRLGTREIPQQTLKPESVLPQTQPLSLKVAENFYLQKDYDKAYATYNRLRQSLPTVAEEELMRDFLQLKMALCMKKAGDSDQANHLFRTVSKSRSPVVRAVANYHAGLLEVQKKQYLKARTRAYQVIALIGAVDFDKDWAFLLQRDCYFLVAESMTRNVLWLCDADKDLPEKLWSNPADVEPFTNLNEAQLRSFLNSGSEQLSKGLLGPQIQRLEQQGTSPRYSVVCHGSSIEELLVRFAANAGLDISWVISRTPVLEGTKDTIRKRPVSLYMPAATPQQLVTVAAGHVGLLTGLDERGVVNIFNPADYSSLSEHISLLSREAILLWQRFLLMFHDDERVPNAHFALGLLQAQKGQVTDAIAEYKLVANRHPQASLAPFALLHSSKLKTNLRDYFGAREDLKQLVEQYPDTELSERACLYLADATMKARLYDEAGRLYRKAYNLGLSFESQTASALGAGRCFYEEKDYETAAKWLTRYTTDCLARDYTGRDLYWACFLLGKTNLALGKPEAACDAFQYALAGQLSTEEYVETISALVETQIQQGHFVEALDVLENTHSVAFSKKESINILLLRSKTLRAMGLVDKAIAALGDRAQYLLDPQLKARTSFELTKCYIAKGDLELARRNLAEILVLVEPGPLAHEVGCELADVCLKLGQNSQTISICSQLLDSTLSAPIKRRALNILATAYSRQKNYDRAALALLGQWNKAQAQNEKRTFKSPTTAGQSLYQTQ